MTAAARVGSLCSGYGGLELALTLVAPTAVAWVADADDAASRVLAHRFTAAPNLGDIRAVNWATMAPVDVLTCGYPCQPVSLAGRQRGTDDERWIWPDVLRAVRALRPSVVFLENVSGHLRHGFGTVLGDLAEVGYVGSWTCLRAGDVGAPHRRERVFILARPADAHRPGRGHAGPAGDERIPAAPVTGGVEAGRLSLLPTPRATDGSKGGPNQRGSSGDLMLPSAVMLLPTPAARDWRSGESNIMDRNARPLNEVAVNLLPTPAASKGTGAGHSTDGRNPRTAVAAARRWGDYEPAIHRWEQATGRRAPEPTEPGRTGRPRLAPRFVEWLMGLPDGWVTDVPDISRNSQLRVLGNGVVPQQAAAAYRALSASIDGGSS